MAGVATATRRGPAAARLRLVVAFAVVFAAATLLPGASARSLAFSNLVSALSSSSSSYAAGNTHGSGGTKAPIPAVPRPSFVRMVSFTDCFELQLNKEEEQPPKFLVERVRSTLRYWQTYFENHPKADSLKVLLGPEWYFRKSVKGSLKDHYTAKEYDELRSALLELSKEFADWLLMPGTAVRRKGDALRNTFFALYGGVVVHDNLNKGSGANYLSSAIDPSPLVTLLNGKQKKTWEEITKIKSEDPANASLLPDLGNNVFNFAGMHLCADICYDLHFCRAAWQLKGEPLMNLCDIHFHSSAGFVNRDDDQLASEACIKKGGYMFVADNCYLGKCYEAAAPAPVKQEDIRRRLRAFKYVGEREGDSISVAWHGSDCIVASNTEEGRTDFRRATQDFVRVDLVAERDARGDMESPENSRKCRIERLYEVPIDPGLDFQAHAQSQKQPKQPKQSSSPSPSPSPAPSPAPSKPTQKAPVPPEEPKAPGPASKSTKKPQTSTEKNAN